MRKKNANDKSIAELILQTEKKIKELKLKESVYGMKEKALEIIQERMEWTKYPTMVIRKGNDIVGVLNLAQKFGFDCEAGKVSRVFINSGAGKNSGDFFAPEDCTKYVNRESKEGYYYRDREIEIMSSQCSMFYKSPQSTTDSQSTPTTGAPK